MEGISTFFNAAQPAQATQADAMGLTYQTIGQPAPAAGAAPAPIFGSNIKEQSANEDSLAKNIEVIGFISEKKNLLSKANDPKDIERECAALYDKFVKEGRPLEGDAADPYFSFPGKKINKDGNIEDNGKVVKLKKKTKTIGTLLAVDKEAHDRVVSRQVYKVKLNELNPKYYILKNKEVAEKVIKGDFTEAFTYSKAALTLSGMKAIFSEDKSICIMDPVALTKAQLSAGNRYLSVVNREGKKAGNISPTIKSKTQGNKTKTVYTSIVTDNLANTYQSVGYLGVPGFAHRSYEGQQVHPEVVLNEEDFKKYFPTSSIKDLRIQAVNPQIKGEQFNKKQEIEWSKLATVASALGVSEQMLQQIRGKKSGSKSKSMSAADIEEKFRDAYTYYTQQAAVVKP